MSEILDHCPMVLHLDQPKFSYGPAPFKFQGMCCTQDNFLPCLKEVWQQPKGSNGLVKLATKLKRTKIVLHVWNKHSFGLVDQNIQALEEGLELLQH